MNRLSLSKVAENSGEFAGENGSVLNHFRDEEDASISAIPVAGDETAFGPLVDDTELANMSIYDMQR